jgi:flagellar protein FlaG
LPGDGNPPPAIITFSGQRVKAMSTTDINAIHNMLRVGNDIAPPDTQGSTANPGATTDVIDKNAVTEAFKKTEEEALSKEDLEEVARFLNESTDLFNVSLSFQINEDIDRVIVSVTDKTTDEVIRQIPPDEIIRLAERLHEMVGVLFNQTA